MEAIANVIIMGILTLSNIACFTLGALVMQKAQKDERIVLPSVNPLKGILENRVKKEAEMEQHRVDTILRNIENFDGTAFGQEDVPGR